MHGPSFHMYCAFFRLCRQRSLLHIVGLRARSILNHVVLNTCRKECKSDRFPQPGPTPKGVVMDVRKAVRSRSPKKKNGKSKEAKLRRSD